MVYPVFVVTLRNKPLWTPVLRSTFLTFETLSRTYAYLTRRLGLLPVHFLKELLQTQLKRLILGALVELAQIVPAGAESVITERQAGVAEILPFRLHQHLDPLQ